MAKTITLKFAATCKDCGAALEAGQQAKWYGRGRIYGIGCHEKPEGVTARPARPTPDLTCPTCKTPNALTPEEARKGYQCRRCADLEEGVGYPMTPEPAPPAREPGPLAIFYGSTKVGAA